jgi:hypothetical protein
MAKPKPAVEEEKKQPPTSAQVLEAMLQDGKDEHFAFVTPTHRIISTGSLILDSLVKVRSGGVVRLLGRGAELGKTSQGLVFLANYMKTMPKAKGLFIAAEARLSDEMKTRSGLTFVTTTAEWVDGTVFVFPCNVFERVADTIETQLKAMYERGEHLGILLDSLDGLQLRADAAKTIWAPAGKEAPKVAGVALLTKLLLKRIGLPITHYDALFLATSQYSVDIKLDPYSPNIPRQGDAAGGNAIAHQSDYAFQYSPRFAGDMILENPTEKPDWQKNKIIGVYATLEIKKSGTDVTGTKLKIPIRKGRVGCAIWVEKEITDMLLGWQLLAKKPPGKDKDGKEMKGGGSWLYFNEELIIEVKAATGVELVEKVNGVDNAFRYLEGEPKVVEYLYSKFTKLANGDE